MTRSETWRHRFRQKDRFGLLLALLVTAFLLTGLGGDPAVRLLLGLLNIATLAVGFLSTRLHQYPVQVMFLAAIGTAGSVMVSTAPFNDLVSSIGATAQVLLMLVLTIAVLDAIFQHDSVTAQTIAGSIAAYFLLGQVFAWGYAALPGFFEEEVIEPVEPGQVPVYYSYVVLTTLGFGDVVPVGAFAKRVTVVEALTGQMFIAVFVSLLVSRLPRRARRVAAPDGE